MSERTCIIPLGANGQYEAVVDEEDYAFLTQWRWSYKISQWKYGQKVYARRHQRINGVRKTILMHVQILEERMGKERPSDIHTVHHINKDSLINRRRNLEWATPSTQSKEQKKRITKAEKAVFDAALAA